MYLKPIIANALTIKEFPVNDHNMQVVYDEFGDDSYEEFSAEDQIEFLGEETEAQMLDIFLVIIDENISGLEWN